MIAAVHPGRVQAAAKRGEFVHQLPTVEIGGALCNRGVDTRKIAVRGDTTRVRVPVLPHAISCDVDASCAS